MKYDSYLIAAGALVLLAAQPALADHSSDPVVTSMDDHDSAPMNTADTLKHQLEILQQQADALMMQLKMKQADDSTDAIQMTNGAMAHECHLDDDLANGASGERVSCLQGILIAGKYLPIAAPTGYFGPLTLEAVQKWQAANGLPATGYFGPLSREKYAAMKSMMDDHGATHHTQVNMDGAIAPTLHIAATKDAKDGWNVQLVTTNFRFAPEHASGAHSAGEGHAHVYVDGVKVGRLYGAWTHVSQANLSHGSHEIKVTLNTNDHNEYAVNGASVQSVANVIVE
jgi:hypothetical protein